MDLGLEERTALVLGSSSGLGLASAEALREEGASVVMFARREELLRQQAARVDATAFGRSRAPATSELRVLEVVRCGRDRIGQKTLASPTEAEVRVGRPPR